MHTEQALWMQDGSDENMKSTVGLTCVSLTWKVSTWFNDRVSDRGRKRKLDLVEFPLDFMIWSLVGDFFFRSSKSTCKNCRTPLFFRILDQEKFPLNLPTVVLLTINLNYSSGSSIQHGESRRELDEAGLRPQAVPHPQWLSQCQRGNFPELEHVQGDAGILQM